MLNNFIEAHCCHIFIVRPDPGKLLHPSHGLGAISSSSFYYFKALFQFMIGFSPFCHGKRSEMQLEELGAAQNSSQHIIKIMGHTASHFPQAPQLFCLQQLGLHSALLGYINTNLKHPDDLSIFILKLSAPGENYFFLTSLVGNKKMVGAD